MSTTTETVLPWRDLTDPRRATFVDDLEAGLKEPIFESLENSGDVRSDNRSR